jgi:hypothetical protein
MEENMKEETYPEMLRRHREDFNRLPIIWAFSKEQLELGLEAHGVKRDEIIEIGAGGFISRSDAPALKAVLQAHKGELKARIEADNGGLGGFIHEMFTYELLNYEYPVTGDVQDALDALGMSVEEIKRNRKLHVALELAKQRAMEAAQW